MCGVAAHEPKSRYVQYGTHAGTPDLTSTASAIRIGLEGEVS